MFSPTSYFFVKKEEKEDFSEKKAEKRNFKRRGKRGGVECQIIHVTVQMGHCRGLVPLIMYLVI